MAYFELVHHGGGLGFGKVGGEHETGQLEFVEEEFYAVGCFYTIGENYGFSMENAHFFESEKMDEFLVRSGGREADLGEVREKRDI